MDGSSAGPADERVGESTVMVGAVRLDCLRGFGLGVASAGGTLAIGTSAIELKVVCDAERL